MSSSSLQNQTLLITGSSRGIGKAIALRAARDGANVIVLAKTNEPHPKLPGTVRATCDAIESEGGKAFPCIADVRSEAAMQDAISAATTHFGGIDILINNASAIALTGTTEVSMSRFDLMHQVNTRGTFLCAKLCLPYLKQATNPHILTLSPPLDLDPKWFAPHVAYTLSKYGMSLCTLGLAAELKGDGIAVNSLWPRTTIATAAVRHLGGDGLISRSRQPEMVADAAHAIVTAPSRKATGQFFIDEDVLRAEGISDFSNYAVDSSQPLQIDLFVNEKSD